MALYIFYVNEPDVPFTYLSPSRSVGRIPLPGGLTTSPEKYLEYATADLRDGDERGVVNAFGNAKRALHLAVDTLLHQYGLLVGNHKLRFPSKLELLDCVGLLPIAILRNLNVERNAVEHDYETPTRQRAEEAVDVARLLLLAIERLVEATPHEAVVGWKGPPLRHMVLQLDPHRGVISLTRFWAPGRYRRRNGTSAFLGTLRQPFSGELDPDVRLATRPSVEVPLTKVRQSDWMPIIKQLVSSRRRSITEGIEVDRETWTASLSVTIPLEPPEGQSWASVLDQAMQDRAQSQEESAVDETGT